MRSGPPVATGDPGLGHSAVPFLFGCADAEELPGPLLVALLGDLGWSPPGARALLRRMTRYGMLSSRRDGRIAGYRLAGLMRDRFVRHVSGGPPRDWDGRFHLLVHRIPETRRRARDALLSAADGHGYRQLRPGVLLACWDESDGFLPQFADEDVIAGWLELGADRDAVVARCWDLPAVAAQLTAVADDIDRVLAEPPDSDVACLRALAAGMGRALTIQLGAAALPPQLLPDDWPGARLGDRMGAAAGVLGPGVARRIGRLTEELGVADRIVSRGSARRG